MSEQWRDIPGYEGVYQVSDLGRVCRLPGWIPCPQAESGQRWWPGGMLNPGFAGRERCYAYVILSFEGSKRNWYIHDLVLLAFVGSKPGGLEVLHGLGGKSDNRLVNLLYGTASQNQMNRRRDGTGSNVPVRRSDGVEFDSLREAASVSGLRGSSTISMVLSGRRKIAGGFNWEKI